MPKSEERVLGLLEVPANHDGYHEALKQVLFRAWSDNRMSFEFDQFFSPLLRGDPPNQHRIEHTATLYWMGRLYEREGDPQHALRAYRAADRLAPGFEDVGHRIVAITQSLSLPNMQALPALPPDPVATPTPRRVRASRASAAFDRKWRSQPIDPELSRKIAERASTLGLDPLEPGTVVADRYRIDAPLGEGGYGVVFRVTDMMIDEPAALKLFRRGLEDPTGLRRFKQEMRITRRLFHKAIVRTFEFGAWAGLHFITMELLEGIDLAHAIHRRRPLPIAEVLRLCHQAFEALHAAHELGIVHRDVKPENLFVMADGSGVKVMDFGLSLAKELSVRKTSPGLVVGTPAYVAPERLRGGADPTDPRIDVYGMGLVLYEGLAGRLPWRSNDVAGVFQEILERTPPAPSTFRPEIPREIDDLVADLLARDPADRIPTAEEAAHRLMWIMRGMG
jgi:hypothetical protein